MEETKELEVLTPEEEQEKENKKKSSALSGFIFSLVAWNAGIGLIGLVLAILGLVFSCRANKVKSPTHRSFSTVGKVLSIISIVLCIVVPIIAFCIALIVGGVYLLAIIIAAIAAALA